MRTTVLLLLGAFLFLISFSTQRIPSSLRLGRNKTKALVVTGKSKTRFPVFIHFVLTHSTEPSANRWFDLPPVSLVGAGWAECLSGSRAGWLCHLASGSGLSGSNCQLWEWTWHRHKQIPGSTCGVQSPSAEKRLWEGKKAQRGGVVLLDTITIQD